MLIVWIIHWEWSIFCSWLMFDFFNIPFFKTEINLSLPSAQLIKINIDFLKKDKRNTAIKILVDRFLPKFFLVNGLTVEVMLSYHPHLNLSGSPPGIRNIVLS